MSLVSAKQIQKLCKSNNAILFTAIRNHWNKDYKPAEYPLTHQQRLAAAKKYALHPDDYKPFPNDGRGYGDYPQLPVESADSRDPNYPWDNPELKRNFNEPMQVDFDLFSEDRYDVSYKHRISLLGQLGQFCAVVFGGFALYAYLEQMKQFPALLPKQYPHSGVKHYSFDRE